MPNTNNENGLLCKHLIAVKNELKLKKRDRVNERVYNRICLSCPEPHCLLDDGVDYLAIRNQEIASMLAEGVPTQVIAWRLKVSRYTVYQRSYQERVK